MESGSESAAPVAVAVLARLHSALVSGDVDAIRASFLDCERALERAPAAVESRARIDAALTERLVASCPVSGWPRALVEILVLGWTLRGDHGLEGAHRALFGRAPDLAYGLEVLSGEVVSLLVASEDDVESHGALRVFLLERAGRVENLLRVPLWEHESVEVVLAAPAAECCRQLARRRTMFAAERLTRLPDTLEGRLHEARVFDALVAAHADTTPLLRLQLQSYGYLERASILQRLRAAAVTAVREALRVTAGERWAYDWTQGPGRFAAQWALMVFTAVVVGLGLVAVTQWHANRRAHLDRDLRTVSAWIETERRVLEDEAATSRADLRALEAQH